MKSKKWLMFALITTLSWGLWGAMTGLFADETIPSTLVYSIWALTMIPPCLIALKLIAWKLDYDKRSVILGCSIGLLGSGGQMLLFQAVNVGPAYLIFPIVSLSPIITIALSFGLLGERTGKLGAFGIVLALIALPLFEYSAGPAESQSQGLLWFALALFVMAAWGLQAFFMKFSNESMSAESIFFYMTITALALIPMAYAMTDFTQEINTSGSVLLTTAGIQVLNSIGALCLVYAFRHGKAILVSPLTNAGAPLISAVLAIILMGVVPSDAKMLGIALAIIAAVILAIEPEDKDKIEKH
ncbi:DMT family transporter [Paraglaciecola sp.]|uniref:DMT family transporter n=1 Tax=Paraglaciecola sp. TaxID=1920173 RepID=UPI0032645022